MKWFVNLPIGRKLALGFGVCLALAVVVGATAMTRMAQMNAGTRTIVSGPLAGTEIVANLISDMKQVRLLEYNHLMENEKARMDHFEELMKDRLAEVDQGLTAYAKTISQPEDRTNFDAMSDLWKAYMADHDKLIELGRKNEDKAANELMLARLDTFTRLSDQLDKITAWNKRHGNDLAQASATTYSNASSVVVTLLIAAVFIGILAGWFISRLITGALIPIAQTAQEIANGDLCGKVAFQSRDELGQLADSFRTMLTNLSQLIANTRVAAESIATASGQVAAGNEDLSQRTEEQASSLEETASSMEEMTATVKQNADNARQANQLAAQASEVAVKGGSVVSTAVASMQEINKASKHIADIISVIDEIAFQTNLLALNASVEAARVGEQGKGFAVVAAEVRNLAGRSAAAAKEIKTLVQDSVQKVQEGSDLVNQSGQQLEEIVTSVKKVADIIAEISAASQEQSAGIEQVNKAIMQMDQITQQNAALVEEAASASASSSRQARELQETVAQFKLDQSFLLSIREQSMSAHRALEAAAHRQEEAVRANGTTGAAPSGKKAGTGKPSLASTKTSVKKSALHLVEADDNFEEF